MVVTDFTAISSKHKHYAVQKVRSFHLEPSEAQTQAHELRLGTPKALALLRTVERICPAAQTHMRVETQAWALLLVHASECGVTDG
jgi:hypothetical protein